MQNAPKNHQHLFEKNADQISRNSRRFSAPEFLRTSITTTRFFCLCKLYATDVPCVLPVVLPNL
jgi:hypothetical protein